MTMTSKPSKPNAMVSVRRFGRYTDDDAVIVTTSVGDIADSHGVAYNALKKAGIKPTRLYPGSMHMTFDPQEIDEKAAMAIVVDALRRGGVDVRIYEP